MTPIRTCGTLLTVMFIQDELLNRGLTSFGSRLNQLAVEQRVAAAKGDLTDGRLDHGKHQSHGSFEDVLLLVASDVFYPAQNPKLVGCLGLFRLPMLPSKSKSSSWPWWHQTLGSTQDHFDQPWSNRPASDSQLVHPVTMVPSNLLEAATGSPTEHGGSAPSSGLVQSVLRWWFRTCVSQDLDSRLEL